VTDAGNWEGKTVLNRLHQPGLGPPDQEASLRAAADVLLAARAERVQPGRDDKVLADWNGLMIAALTRASAVFDEPAWLERARSAFGFVCREMSAGDDKLVHSWRDGRRLDRAFLDDYAQMAAAALRLFEHTADRGYLEQALRWIARLDADYLDPEAGGYFQIAAEATDVLVRAKNAQDGPTPAANGTLLAVLARLACLTREERYRRRSEELLQAFSGEAIRNPAVHAALLSGAMLLERPVQIVLIGDPADPELHALRRVALAAPASDAIVLTCPPDQPLPAGHPAAGKPQLAGRATAYVCPGQTCRLPITDPDELAPSLTAQSLVEIAV